MNIAILALNKADYLELKHILKVDKNEVILTHIETEKQLWGNSYNAVIETAKAKEFPQYSKLKKEISIRLEANKKYYGKKQK